MTIRADYFGATEVGPRHRAASVLNQDSWLGRRGPFGAMVVASDGVGSRREARRGAQQACLAALEGARAWWGGDDRGVEALARRVEPAWRALVAPSSVEDCAATCLMALSSPQGQVHVAALGDGAALVALRGGGVEWVLGPRATGFGNETAALGTGAAWITRTFPADTVAAAVVATDGVADDLLPERVSDLVSWLLREITPLPPGRRWRALQRELRAWPTPHHTDDKTIAVLVPQRETRR